MASFADITALDLDALDLGSVAVKFNDSIMACDGRIIFLRESTYSYGAVIEN